MQKVWDHPVDRIRERFIPGDNDGVVCAGTGHMPPGTGRTVAATSSPGWKLGDIRANLLHAAAPLVAADKP